MPFMCNLFLIFKDDQNEAFEVYIFINIDALSTQIRGIYFIYNFYEGRSLRMLYYL